MMTRTSRASLTALLMLPVLALVGCAASTVEPSISVAEAPTQAADVEPTATPEAALTSSATAEHQTAEVFAALLDCMKAEGWQVVASGESAFYVPGQTPEQTPAVRESYQACSEATGW